MKLLITGRPGVGKGTQATKIVEFYGIPHISTGDMFREAMKNGTELGTIAKSYMDKGELVPDEITIGIVRERLQKNDCIKGFLLDGFPRTIAQAKALDETLKSLNWKLDTVLNVEVDKSILIERIVGRRVCKTCGAIYNVTSNKPLKDGICDICDTVLIQRKDDSLETAENRLDVYDNQTAPLLQYYNLQGLLKEINGNQNLEDVFSDIKVILKGVN